MDIFKRVTKYFMEHLLKDLVPYWDFDFDTGSDEPRDSSAGVIAVCGMLEMAKYLDKDEAEYYTQTAKRLLKAILIIVPLKTVKSLTDFTSRYIHKRKHRIIRVITAVLMSVIHGEIISIWRNLHV